jgi:hypothetical protein
MNTDSRGVDSAGVTIRRAHALRTQAQRLRKRASIACLHSAEIREVLLVNDPLKRSGNSVYRGCACLIDVLDRILDNGLRVEPWRRATATGIDLSKGRLTTALIQTHLVNEEMIVGRRKRLRLSPSTGPELGVLRPANFLDMLDRILDKGIVVDSWQHIHLRGIDVVEAKARSVLTSIQTHLVSGNPDRPHVSERGGEGKSRVFAGMTSWAPASSDWMGNTSAATRRSTRCRPKDYP